MQHLHSFCVPAAILAAGLGIVPASGQTSAAPQTTQASTTTPVEDLVYESNNYSDHINGWIFNPSTGKLTTASGPAAADVGPFQMLVSPNRAFLYVVMSNSQVSVRGSSCTNAPAEVISYQIDHTSGALTLIDRQVLNGYCGGQAAAMDHAGKFLYVGETNQTYDSGMVDVLSLDQTTGKMALVSGSPFAAGPNIPNELAVAGNYLYGAQNSQGTSSGILIYHRDTTTGAVTLQSTYSIEPQNHIAALPSGAAIYTVDATVGRLYEFRVNATTGALSLLSTQRCGNSGFEVEASPTGNYVAVASNDGTHVYPVESTGKLGNITGSPFGSSATSAMFDTTGTHFAAIQGGKSLDIYTLSGGTAHKTASTSLANYPSRVTMLTK